MARMSDGGAFSQAEADAAAGLLPRTKVRAPRRLRNGRPAGEQEASTKGPRPQGKADSVRELQRLSITGGSARGRRLRTPDVYLRPMMSRVREALFSMVYPSGVLRDSAKALDLFAGSGVIGLEALSRGMGGVTFVDFSPKCTSTIKENCERLGFEGVGHIVEARVEELLATPERFGAVGPYQLVTMTPPYEEVVYADLIDALCKSPLLGEDTLVVIEYPVELGIFPTTLDSGRLIGLRNRRYGRTVLALYICRPSGKLDLTPFTEEFVSLYKK